MAILYVNRRLRFKLRWWFATSDTCILIESLISYSLQRNGIKLAAQTQTWPPGNYLTYNLTSLATIPRPSSYSSPRPVPHPSLSIINVFCIWMPYPTSACVTTSSHLSRSTGQLLWFAIVIKTNCIVTKVIRSATQTTATATNTLLLLLLAPGSWLHLGSGQHLWMLLLTPGDSIRILLLEHVEWHY